MKWLEKIGLVKQKPQQKPRSGNVPTINAPAANPATNTPVKVATAQNKESPSYEQLIERARLANDAATATDLWRQVLASKPENLATWKEAVTALTKLQAIDAVDAVLCEAVKLFPGELELWYDWGRSAMVRRLPIEEARRWLHMRNQFPKHVHGYLCGARLARKQQQYQAAEQLVADGIIRIGADKRLLLEQANCAEAQSNWPLAVSRWEALEAASALDATSVASFALALVKVGKLEDAEARAQAGLNKYPGDAALQRALKDIQKASN